jgi:adenylate kinase family enzyme
MRRISVIGTSGSGKTTFAKRLSDRAKLPHVELDALFWGPKWTPADTALFRDRVETALSGDAWVCDGNHSAVRPIVLARADTVVWLDLPLHVCLWQALRRNAQADWRERLGQTNRETWSRRLGRDSIFWWILKTHGRRRREYEALFLSPEAAHLELYRIGTTADADAWLQMIQTPETAPEVTPVRRSPAG